MADIPVSHPRRASLLGRQRLVDAAKLGLLADSALIAHGRGEAFDYLLDERTCDSARTAIREVAARLQAAKRPVISINGNTTVLAGKSLIRIAAILGCPLEVNIYYRTPERIEKLLALLKNQRQEISEELALWGPSSATGDWKSAVESVNILGAISDGRILGLEGPRSLCSADGIESADVVLVPLEDGDRCEALIALGKQVLVIDLNPLSRTARQATVTIVDEVSRASSILFSYIVKEKSNPTDWDNDAVLKDALEVMAQSVNRI